MKNMNWYELYKGILAQPQTLPKYYSLFHHYSLGNQLWVARQLQERNIPCGPVATFNRWKQLGRRVKKGEKGLSMFVPRIYTKKVVDENGEEQEETRVFFTTKNLWFALAQTEEDPYFQGERPPVPGQIDITWDKKKALAALGICEVPFNMVDGNVQGFAQPKEMAIAVSPIAGNPWVTLFHEIAHCLLHSGYSDKLVDNGRPEKNVMEAEAEAVALLCVATLELPGIETCQAYIQSWIGTGPEAEQLLAKSMNHVFQAADRILRVGMDLPTHTNETEFDN